MDTIDLLKGSRQDGLFDEVNSVDSCVAERPKSAVVYACIEEKLVHVCEAIEPPPLSHACLHTGHSSAVRVCGHFAHVWYDDDVN